MGLSKLTNLSSLSLNLFYNSITDSGAKDLSEGLSKLTNLSSLSLNLDCNSITDSGAKDLFLTKIAKLQLKTQNIRFWSTFMFLSWAI